LIDDEDPAGIGVGGDGLLDVGGEVLVGASLSYGGSYDLAGSHLEVGDQTLGAVAFVLVLLALAASPARLHQNGRMEPLKSLDARLLIGANQIHPFFV
jgi:hypothetical protein